MEKIVTYIIDECSICPYHETIHGQNNSRCNNPIDGDDGDFFEFEYPGPGEFPLKCGLKTVEE